MTYDLRLSFYKRYVNIKIKMKDKAVKEHCNIKAESWENNRVPFLNVYFYFEKVEKLTL